MYLVVLYGLLSMICRGVDHAPVESKGPPKSIVSGMSLNPITDLVAVEKIFTSLATDLVERMRVDYYQHNRVPVSLVVGIRLGGTTTQKNHTVLMPKRNYDDDAGLEVFGDTKYLKVIVSSGMGVFGTMMGSTKGWSITRLSLVASNFDSCTLPPTSDIQKFFQQSVFPSSTTKSIVPDQESKGSDSNNTKTGIKNSNSNNKSDGTVDTTLNAEKKRKVTCTIDSFFKRLK